VFVQQSVRNLQLIDSSESIELSMSWPMELFLDEPVSQILDIGGIEDAEGTAGSESRDAIPPL
jgi:hypothetical protein